MTLKEIIKELCKQNQVSMNKLESDLGFAKGYLSKLDKSTPNSTNLRKIADYFNVTLDYLMTGNESTEKKSKYEAKDKTERDMLVLCRSLENVPEDEKEALINNFKNSIDIFLKAKGIK